MRTCVRTSDCEGRGEGESAWVGYVYTRGHEYAHGTAKWHAELCTQCAGAYLCT